MLAEEQRCRARVQCDLDHRTAQCTEMMQLIEQMKCDVVKERQKRQQMEEEKLQAQRSLSNHTMAHEAELLTVQNRVKFVSFVGKIGYFG